MQKILFELEQADHHNFSAETMWLKVWEMAKFKLLNIPLYVYGASFADIVLTKEADEESGFPIVEQVVVRSGHSTYRLYVPDSIENNEEFETYWSPVEECGCSFESQIDNQWLGIDVPPDADIFRVYRLLEIGEEKGAWEFEEGNCAHAT